MIQISATDFAAICGGIATIIAAVSGLVWAFRRDPRSGGTSDVRRLPPSEE